MSSQRILVTGGVRSGKSRHAEALARDAGTPITYLAPGPVYDDADWAARIAAHRARRPEHWTTVESHELAGVLADTEGGVLVDCLGTWLTAVMDDEALWEVPMETSTEVIAQHLQHAADALRARDGLTLLVTNEVGMGIVPEHRSGRVFRDLLGLANQQLAAACDEVHLVVAGRVIVL